MNKVVLMGRLTRDPEVRYSQGENALAIARYTLAVDRRFKRDGEQSADFIKNPRRFPDEIFGAARECALRSADESRPEAIPTEMV